MTKKQDIWETLEAIYKQPLSDSSQGAAESVKGKGLQGLRAELLSEEDRRRFVALRAEGNVALGRGMYKTPENQDQERERLLNE